MSLSINLENQEVIFLTVDGQARGDIQELQQLINDILSRLTILEGQPSNPSNVNYAIYKTTQEINTQIKITSNGEQSEHKVMYSLKIDNLKPTDIVFLFAQAEITNPKTFNIGVGRRLIATTSNIATLGSVIAGIPVVMDNITPDIHHGVIQTQGVDTGRTGTVYYNYFAYAVSSVAGINDIATIEQGYGGITAVVVSS